MMAVVLETVANGDLTTSEGGEVAKLIEGYIKTIEANEFELRLQTLERMARK